MINVGLSRKASENFQSTGTSINITAELDQSLLGRPNQLQEEIDHLFGQASDALDRQSDRLQAETDKLGSTSTHGRDGRPNGSDSGHTNTNGQAAVPSPRHRAVPSRPSPAGWASTPPVSATTPSAGTWPSCPSARPASLSTTLTACSPLAARVRDRQHHHRPTGKRRGREGTTHTPRKGLSDDKRTKQRKHHSVLS